ncbi:hypothetical protein [Corallococcus llansteffanensis]|uniref:NHL repeat-containing protein n=1 Tax=Corallococcus llansteffanensis TaxID=2316731 RepID=A0A3A8PU57_9BACT|nr:hypothetical protein [Corallococcus llansteffanensis]RKH55952.1 hypothetical protein D7V93_21370 [Corallococcus llansteffanensis]
MRLHRLCLLGLFTLMAACGAETTPTPPPPTFLVGGRLGGLDGTLTLQLNGREQLTLAADGPFTFETRLADRSDYTVIVTASPPEQECFVEDGMGTVAGADVGPVLVHCAARTYSIGGTVEGLAGTLELGLGGETLQVTSNGRFTFKTRLPKGGAYTVSLVSLPTGQRCTVSHEQGTVAGNVEDVSVRCVHWYALDSFQAARTVVGQADFTSNEPNRDGAAGPGTLSVPWGNPALAGGRLYVSDQGNRRVLGFDGVPTVSGAGATLVLGQPDFVSTATGAGQAGLSGPEGLSSDGSRLAVTDPDNSRVLLHAPLPASLPTLVVGQAGFEGPSRIDCDSRTLQGPEDVFVGHGKLVVADSGHNRVLVWNTLPTTNGAAADLVLGQGSPTTCTANDANGDQVKDAAPSASTLWSPTGVWTDGTRLAVVDFANHRVLLWNTFPTRNGQPADVVLGQPGFTSRLPSTSASGMNSPYFVASTGQQLFVADNQNHRVLGWNQLPQSNGAPADLVLGQADLTSARQVDPDTSAPSARSLFRPSGLLLAWPHVVVPDAGNNRLLVFESH